MKTPAETLQEVYDFFGPKAVVDGIFQPLSAAKYAAMTPKQASIYDFYGAELMHDVAKVLALSNGDRKGQ